MSPDWTGRACAFHVHMADDSDEELGSDTRSWVEGMDAALGQQGLAPAPGGATSSQTRGDFVFNESMPALNDRGEDFAPHRVSEMNANVPALPTTEGLGEDFVPHRDPASNARQDFVLSGVAPAVGSDQDFVLTSEHRGKTALCAGQSPSTEAPPRGKHHP